MKAVDNGIDFQGLYGVDANSPRVDDETPNLAYFASPTRRRHVLYQRPQTSPRPTSRSPGRRSDSAWRRARANRAGGAEHHYFMVSLPIARQGGRRWAGCNIGIDVGFVDHIVLEMLYDVLVVLVVALFFTLELLHFIAGAVSRPR